MAVSKSQRAEQLYDEMKDGIERAAPGHFEAVAWRITTAAMGLDLLVEEMAARGVPVEIRVSITKR